MKKGFKLFAIMASAIFALTACTSDKLEAVSGQPDNNPESPNNAISFGTYMGKTGTTRAGAYGAIDDTKLRTAGYGFGVFAYYTGTSTYEDYRTQNATGTKKYPNFMYNQKVSHNGSSWEYTPVKYWPNEVASGAVDDQNNDSANDPATTAYENGGNVSFFAYAPYAEMATTETAASITGRAVAASDHEGTSYGVVAFSSSDYNGDATTGKEKYSDPYVKYILAKDNDKQVDLLWGTTEGSSENVLDENLQLGVSTQTYDATSGYDTNKDGTTDEFFNVNTDLTKQKVTGTVNFIFKHALAKIGGSHIGGGDGTDESSTTATNGLMVVLDIDKDGAEMGGSLESFTNGGTTYTAGSTAAEQAQTPFKTKVTINSIKLESGKELTETGVTAIKTNNTFVYNDTYTTWLTNEGILNLATGVWSDTKAATTDITRTQEIVTSGSTFKGETDDEKKDAVLLDKIAEPISSQWTNNHTQEAFEKLPIGVTTVPKNVYQNEVQPFVFIPGTHPVITITVDYNVRTFDDNLKDKYTEVRQKITKRLYILDKIELNKQYNILMRLGLTSVKFSATVDEWDEGSNDVTGRTDGTGSDVLVADETVEHVYLPINVAELTAATVQYPANLAFTWNEDGAKNLGYATLTYSDGTTHKTNDEDGEGNFITPLISWTATSITGTATITKVMAAETGYEKGDLKITWGGKNLTTKNRAARVTFSYGNQSADLANFATQPCGPLAVTKGSPSITSAAGTYDYITEVKAGDGEGDAVTDWTVWYETSPGSSTYTTTAPEWIESFVVATGKITLKANDTGADRSVNFYLKKDDAKSTEFTITQPGS